MVPIDNLLGILLERDSNLKVVEVTVSENGVYYGRAYYWSVIWERSQGFLRSIFSAFWIFVDIWALYLCKVSPKRLSILVILFYGYFWYQEAFNYVAEEFFPSDHQILVATIQS
jgi:hypothetical protein